MRGLRVSGLVLLAWMITGCGGGEGLAGPNPEDPPAGLRASEDLAPAPESLETTLEELLRQLQKATEEGRAPDAGQPGEKGAGAPGPGYSRNPMRTMRESVRREIRDRKGPKLRDLMARYETAGNDGERMLLMKEISLTFRSYGETGGDLGPLAFLERVAREGTTRKERTSAVIAVHTLWQEEVVDFLLRMAELPEESVRFYAVEGLAWVTGEERPRAVKRVVAGMDDEVARIRGCAALALAIVVADPARVPDILDRLAREPDPATAKHMASSVLKLDPAGGRLRILQSIETAPAENRRLVEGVLRDL